MGGWKAEWVLRRIDGWKTDGCRLNRWMGGDYIEWVDDGWMRGWLEEQTDGRICSWILILFGPFLDLVGHQGFKFSHN